MKYDDTVVVDGRDSVIKRISEFMCIWSNCMKKVVKQYKLYDPKCVRDSKLVSFRLQ